MGLNGFVSIGMLQRKLSESKGEELDDEDNELIPCWMFDEVTSSTKSTTYERSITNELAFTDETVVRRVYTLARILHDSFSTAGILYWTSGGTLLGCVRHQGLIPWDDDLDLCIYQKDEGKLNGCLRQVLSDKGCEIIEAPVFGYRIFHRFDSESLPGKYQKHRYPFCDIFVMKKKARTCSIANGCGRAMWPEEYYCDRDIENMQPRLFGNAYLNCPENFEGYLSRTYGEDWQSEGATHNYDHIHQEFVNSVRFKLLKEHYQPARPFL